MDLSVVPQANGSAQSSAPGQQDSPAGIHCANPDCRTRAGERSRGHQSCRSLLCGHCCQNAARAAAEAGEQRPICKVHSRRVHTGHRPLPKESPSHHQESIQQQQQQPPQQQPPSHPPPQPQQPVPPPVWPPSTSSDPETIHELFDKRAHLEQSLRRSITIVVWYRNGAEPLRLPHEVNTFPLFRLQDFPELVGELGLQTSSYVDSYNSETGQWEQHKITTVRTVEQDQRLLYRLRPSLLDSLSDCPQLDQELTLQSQPVQLKRTAEGLSSPTNKQARVISNPVPVRPPAPSISVNNNPPSTAVVGSPSTPLTRATNRLSQPWTPGSGTPAPNAIPAAGSPSSTTNWGFAPSGNIPIVNRQSHNRPATAANGLSDGSASSSQPGTKRWPTDFSVHEITEGFSYMNEIMSMDPRERQKGAFERVFRCRYVKSTVGRAKLYWKRASQEIKDHFLALPKDDSRGQWQNFVHLMDGRLVIEVPKDIKEDDGSGADRADSEEALGSSLHFPSQHHPHISPHLSVARSPDGSQHAGLGRGPSDPSALMHTPNDILRQSLGQIVSAQQPAMPMPQYSHADRNLGMNSVNRSSSSLSGAITIHNS